KAATLLVDIWWHRRLQRAKDRTKKESLSSPGASGNVRRTSPPHRLPRKRAPGSISGGDPLPPSPAARYLQPLSNSRKGNFEMARKAGVRNCETLLIPLIEDEE